MTTHNLHAKRLHFVERKINGGTRAPCYGLLRTNERKYKRKYIPNVFFSCFRYAATDRSPGQLTPPMEYQGRSSDYLRGGGVVGGQRVNGNNTHSINGAGVHEGLGYDHRWRGGSGGAAGRPSVSIAPSLWSRKMLLGAGAGACRGGSG